MSLCQTTIPLSNTSRFKTLIARTNSVTVYICEKVSALFVKGNDKYVMNIVTYTFHIYGISRFVINDNFNLMYTTYSVSIDKRQTTNRFKMIASEIKVIHIIVRVAFNELCIVCEQISILNIYTSISYNAWMKAICFHFCETV